MADEVVEKAAKPKENAKPKGSRGVQSIEIGGALLRVLTRAEAPMKLRDLAEEAGLSPAQAHGYLVSFRNLDLVEQDASGKYQLGPFALHMGMTRLRNTNAYRMTVERAPALAEDLQLMVALTVWGTHGPTIVWVQESSSRIHANVLPGGIFMMTVTATGKTFAAFMPPAMVEPLIRSELDSVAATQRAALQVEEASYRRMVEEVRRQGFAITLDQPIPGVSAIAAPVFDHSGMMQLAVTIIGPTGYIDLSPDGPSVKALMDFTRALSQDLGYRP